MIHIIIGTKAQYIKMAPLMRSLGQQRIAYNLIDTGQHGGLTQKLRQELDIAEPGVFLSREQNVSTRLKAVRWLLDVAAKSMHKAWIQKEVFLNRGGICLIHGEPLSSLLGLYLAKRCGLKVAHIESGLFSFNWFSPFPEEIIRTVIIRYADILFAPSQWAFGNLTKKGYAPKAVCLKANTSLESVHYSLTKKNTLAVPFQTFALLTFHRAENIFKRSRLVFLINLIAKITAGMPLVFIEDPPTRRQLERTRMAQKLDSFGEKLLRLEVTSHANFIHLLKNCAFIITDGGSIQEECYYLDKPCLLLREHTERREGIDENVLLSKFSHKTVNGFLQNHRQFHRRTLSEAPGSPSKQIIEYVLPLAAEA